MNLARTIAAVILVFIIGCFSYHHMGFESLAQDIDPQFYDIGNPVLADLWVDPVAGNDNNNGSSRQQALATIDEAWRRVPSDPTQTGSGYRIQLVRGEYPESSLPSGGWMASRHGTYHFPVIVQSTDGPLAAHIHGYLNLFDVHYLYLIGLDFVTDPGYGGGGNVVHVASSDHILVRLCRLNGFDGSTRQPQETFKVNQVQYIYVERSEFAGAFWFSLDYVAVQYGHIQGNRIHDSGDDCLVLKGGTSYIRVEANEIYNAGVIGFTAGQGTGFEFMDSPWLHYEAYDLKFINNVVHDAQNAGMAVRGGYNILLAYNTLYRVGIGNTGGPMLLAAQGGRSCDGDTSDCQARHDVGGWGPISGSGEWVPNQNVYVYNNILYNPAPDHTMWSHFDIHGLATTPPETNIPSPAAADANLQIRGNVVWNGDASMPIGVEDSSQGCQASNPACNEAQLVADNIFNSIEPLLTSPAAGDFSVSPGSNILGLHAYAIPAFQGNDRPQPPLSPGGNLGNTVARDFNGAVRAPDGPPGALLSQAVPQPPTLYMISGRVVDQSGNALAGVLMMLTGSAAGTASVTTGDNGDYSFSGLPAGGNYIATPSRRKYVFNPAQASFSGLQANVSQDFIGIRKKHK
jgi:hypothetical protein